MRFWGSVTQGGGRQTALPWAIVSLPLRGARPNKSLQATAAAPFLLDGLGESVLAGSGAAQCPAAVPELVVRPESFQFLCASSNMAS